MGNSNHFVLLMNDGNDSNTATGSSSSSPFVFKVHDSVAFTHSLSTLVFPEVLSDLFQVQAQLNLKAKTQTNALWYQNVCLMEHNQLLWSIILKQNGSNNKNNNDHGGDHIGN